MILTEHLARSEAGGIDVTTPWYKNCIERLQQIFLQASLIYLRMHVVVESEIIWKSTFAPLVGNFFVAA